MLASSAVTEVDRREATTWKTSKMGQRDIRRLPHHRSDVCRDCGLPEGALKGAPEGSWLARMMARKPRMLVAIALANKMAPGHLGHPHEGEDYKNPAQAAAA